VFKLIASLSELSIVFSAGVCSLRLCRASFHQCSGECLGEVGEGLCRGFIAALSWLLFLLNGHGLCLMILGQGFTFNLSNYLNIQDA
jgi:hypothetical protein